MNALFIHNSTVSRAGGVLSVNTVYALSFKNIAKKYIEREL